jgi:hypothetical protein
MRVLKGRRSIDKTQKDLEEQRLSDYVSNNIIIPLVTNPHLRGKENYLAWHKESINAIIVNCPIEWSNGKNLTIGMSQKILNLITKDLWALDIIPSNYENFLHIVIDNIILREIGIRRSWTQIESYSEYEKLQLLFREYLNQKNKIEGTHYTPIQLENRIWLKEIKNRKVLSH